jgi:hypothetical protein
MARSGLEDFREMKDSWRQAWSNFRWYGPEKDVVKLTRPQILPVQPFDPERNRRQALYLNSIEFGRPGVKPWEHRFPRKRAGDSGQL